MTNFEPPADHGHGHNGAHNGHTNNGSPIPVPVPPPVPPPAPPPPGWRIPTYATVKAGMLGKVLRGDLGALTPNEAIAFAAVNRPVTGYSQPPDPAMEAEPIAGGGAGGDLTDAQPPGGADLAANVSSTSRAEAALIAVPLQSFGAGFTAGPASFATASLTAGPAMPTSPTPPASTTTTTAPPPASPASTTAPPRLDFDAINRAALAILPRLLAEWFPAGRLVGHEFELGDIHGTGGRSLKINVSTGRWADFAGEPSGADPIGLYAAAFHAGNRVAAARALAATLGTGTTPTPTPLPPLAVAAKPRVVATYDYRDEAGDLLFQVLRHDPKDFRQRKPDGAGGWTWKLGDTRRVPLRLPEVIAAVRAGRRVYICEGEKDVLALVALGAAATCNVGGARKWRPDYSLFLTGASVIVLPDNDESGRKHAAEVAAALHGVAASVTVLMLPDLPLKGDVSDWLAAGGTLPELDALADATAIWLPPGAYDGCTDDWPPDPDDGPADPEPPKQPQPQGKRTSRLYFIAFDDLQLDLTSHALVENLLDEGCMSCVYGEPGLGKSFWILDLCLHIALGWVWNGRDVKQGAVVYICAEGRQGIGQRKEAFRQHHNVGTGVPFVIVPCSVNMSAPEADTSDLIALIGEAAQQFGQPVAMVVVDTLNRALAGGNENSPEGMGVFIANCDRIRQETGTHVMAVHHPGKDASRGGRGHSSLPGALDSEIEITGDREARTGIAAVTKQKDMATEGRFGFHLEVVNLGFNDKGKRITSCFVESDAPKPKPASLTDTESTARRYLADLTNAEGQPLPTTAGFPSTPLRGVPEDRWREECETRRLSAAPERESRTKTFRRILVSMTGKQVIACRDGWVWLTRPEITSP